MSFIYKGIIWFLFCFAVSCSPGWPLPLIYYAAENDLELPIFLPVPVGLQVCTIMPGFMQILYQLHYTAPEASADFFFLLVM